MSVSLFPDYQYLVEGATNMKEKNKRLPLEAVKALLTEGLTMRDIRRASGYSTQELSMMNRIWQLPARKRGPKKGWKTAQP